MRGSHSRGPRKHSTSSSHGSFQHTCEVLLGIDGIDAAELVEGQPHVGDVRRRQALCSAQVHGRLGKVSKSTSLGSGNAYEQHAYFSSGRQSSSE